MEVPPPEMRTCNACKKTFSLNMFRKDGESCRYCDDGINSPFNEEEVKEVGINNKIDSYITSRSSEINSYLSENSETITTITKQETKSSNNLEKGTGEVVAEEH